MIKQKRIEDYGINIGEFKKGRLNKITDVSGIMVGHCTIDTEENKTGVTVVIPSEENIFENKLVASSYILNGYVKTTGLVQIEELGNLESIIALTNTLNVGLVHDAVVEYMIEESRKNNVDIMSVNSVVCECNDCYLNNIQNRVVKREQVFKAIEDAKRDFEEGNVGAGKGMSCHGLKGGIGSASRIVIFEGREYTIGVLILTNHGLLRDLTIEGKNIGKFINSRVSEKTESDKGSVISIIATDIPLSDRQLYRVCKRAGVGLARVGSYIGHGSGEIMIAFSSANVIRHDEKRDIVPMSILNENKLDTVFRAVIECEEEAVLNSMVTSSSENGYMGHHRDTLRDYIDRTF